MEPQQPSHSRAQQHPQLHAIVPPTPTSLPPRTASSTPMSSPGLFSPTNPRAGLSVPVQSSSDTNIAGHPAPSPYLHPLQRHTVRETHKALIDSDINTGRKLINQYEVIEEIGRGMHGKVKLARNLQTGENVAIKIIPRFSKKRRLGKVTAKPQQDKTKKEIAILKKIRHPNVVALLEIIDDPELQKIYMVLEHVELGEVVWRKKGLPHICNYERRRIERESRGETLTAEEEKYDQFVERRQAVKEHKRNKMSLAYVGPDHWSMEHGAGDDDGSSPFQSRIQSHSDIVAALDRTGSSLPSSLAASRATSRAPSRTHSVRSLGQMGKAPGSDADPSLPDTGSDIETPGPLRSNPGSATALDGTMYGPYVEDPLAFRGRSPSMADSIISHMSSVDFNPQVHDPFVDDFSYVPCFTFDQARSTFRGTVLGLEYLHYQGVVHRDIKPANLLWTKDYRVKISDFGVSYFGRPIRDGEPGDLVSESEATDFDDDLELAKTVGTPAFFAPELCYTEIDREQPKVSEQIDVWSLGVTLYCLIFARIPFLAEDEFQMFRKIATEEVYIPRRRLRPVDPSTQPNIPSLFKRQNRDPYRDDNELAYEEVDNLLHDLLRRMLTKDPEKRIRLRDIKRHPWVVQGIPNLIGWLDDTDPARPSSGRKIQVDEKDMSIAVIPLTFLERARSVVKKAVGKVMHPLAERGDSRPRRRAPSSVASSGDGMHNPPVTPHLREGRRKSLLGEDYFSGPPPQEERHLTTASLTASPLESYPYDPLATVLPIDGNDQRAPHRLPDGSSDHLANRTASADAVSAASDPRPHNRHSHIKSVSHSFFSHIPSLPHARTTPTTPSFDRQSDDVDMQRAGRAAQTSPEFRARSVDRFFGESDKQTLPPATASPASTPTGLQRVRHPRPTKSIDLDKVRHSTVPSLPSPLQFSSGPITGYQHNSPNSDPNIHERQRNAELEERPRTAHRVEQIPVDSSKPAPRLFNLPSATVRAMGHIRRHSQGTEERGREDGAAHKDANPASIPCPPSPDPQPLPPTREPTMTTIKSTSSTSWAALDTPLSSPSELPSPISSANCSSSKAISDQMTAFQSDPSLPALLSGASSVSADLEGELLGKPGIVDTGPALLENTDALTPPALGKESVAGFPVDQALEDSPVADISGFPVKIAGSSHRNAAPRPAPQPRPEEDDDSDSDECLTMASSKKSKKQPHETPGRRVAFSARRRDTNASVGSTETAKKVTVREEPTPAGDVASLG